MRVVDRNAVEHEAGVTAGLKVMEVLRELDDGVAAAPCLLSNSREPLVPFRRTV